MDQGSLFDSAEVSGRIRAVTDDARRYLEALDSVARMLEPPGNT
ncbi:MAG TPA: hypothetical protein VNL18_01970 [Gemmatimonadales bacterium]|nr:hypothetical protein [Gemmatimonadales bacterium]